MKLMPGIANEYQGLYMDSLIELRGAHNGDGLW